MRYWLSCGQPLKTVAADLGVSPECLRSWRSQMESLARQAQTTNATSESAPSATAKELTLAREIGELRRELEALTRQRDILKGYNHLLRRQSPQRRFEVLHEITQTSTSNTASSQEPSFTVNEVCETLGVCRSGFYAHRHKDQRPRRQQDRVIAAQMQDIFEQNQSCYGSPRLVRDLKKQGVHTSKTRVLRLMKSEGIRPIQKRRVRVKTTQNNPHLLEAPHLLLLEAPHLLLEAPHLLLEAPHLLLEAPPAQKPDVRFYSDITSIPTPEGWLYMAATIDGYSRKCARAPFGWGVQPTTWKPACVACSPAGFCSGWPDGRRSQNPSLRSR